MTDFSKVFSILILAIVLFVAVSLILISAGCCLFKPNTPALLDGSDQSPPLITNSTSPQTTTSKAFMWLALGCAGVFGTGVVLAFLGKSVGIPICLGSISTLVLSLTIVSFYKLLTYIGLAIVLIALGYMIYLVWINRTALVQAVKTAELTKNNLTEEAKTLIFGADEIDHGLAGAIQTPATEKLIAKIRGKT